MFCHDYKTPPPKKGVLSDSDLSGPESSLFNFTVPNGVISGVDQEFLDQSDIELSLILSSIRNSSVLASVPIEAESGKDSPIRQGDVKSFSRSKWSHKHDGKHRDLESEIRKLRAQNEKLKQRLRDAGRAKPLKPESGFESAPELEVEPLLDFSGTKKLFTMDRTSFDPLSYLPSRVQVKDKFDLFIQDARKNLSGTSGEVFVAYLIRVGCLLGALSNCKSYTDVKHTMIGIAGQYVTSDNIASLHAYFFSLQPLEAQAGLPSIQEFSTGIKQFRGLLTNIKELPLYQALEKCMILLCLGGLQPSDWVVDGSSMHSVFKSWEESIVQKTGPMDLLDVVSSVVEFCTDIVVGLETGNLRKKMLPASAFTKYARMSSLYTAYTRGQLADHNLTPIVLNGDLESFSADLERMVNNRSLTPQMRALYTRYLQDVTIWIADIASREKFSDIKCQCPVFLFYGASAIGKSEVMELVRNAVGKACGFPTEPVNVYDLNEDDEFMSNYKHDITTIVIDDMNNRRRKDGDLLAIQNLLRLSNNQPYLTLQPEADKKGRIYAEPKQCIGSSNIRDFGMAQASNKPVALANRVTGMFQIKVADGYADSEGRLDKTQIFYDANGFPIPHHVAKEYRYSGGADGNGFKLEWVDNDWIPIPVLVKRCVDRAMHMKTLQENYIKNLQNARELPVCSGCHMLDHPNWCQCADRQRLRNQSGFTDLVSTVTGSQSFLAGFGGTLLTMADMLKWVPILGRGKFVNLMELGALAILRWFLTVLYQGRRHFPIFFTQWAITLGCTLGGIFVYIHCTDRWFLRFLVLFAIWLYWFLSGLRKYVERALTDKIRGCTSYSDLRSFIGGAGLVALSLAFVRSLKTIGTLVRPIEENPQEEADTIDHINEFMINVPLDPHGNIMPKSMKEVKERAVEKNDWYKLHVSDVPVPHDLSTMTFDQAVKVLSRNLVRFEFETMKDREFGTLFIVDTDIAMAPKHAMAGNYKFRKIKGIRNPDDTRSWFYANLCNPRVILDDNGNETDFVLYQMTRAPPFQSMLKFFPDEVTKKFTPCKMVKKDRSCNISVSPLVSYDYEEVVETTAYKGPGSKHQFDTVFTEQGDCMSPMVAASGAPKILSLHMGGNEVGTTASYPVTKKWIEAAKSKFPKDLLISESGEELKPGDVFIPQASLEELSLSSYGKDIFSPLSEPHERAAVRFLRDKPSGFSEHPPCLEVYGEDKKMIVRPRSEVRRTLLSPFLEQRGNVCKWGPPRMNSGKAHAEYFEKATQGLNQLDPGLLYRAQVDYVTGCISHLKALDYPRVKVISLYDALNGIPGKRYIKRIDEDTSAGLGLPGKKSDHLDTFFKETNGEKYFEPKSYLEEEIKRRFDCWDRRVMTCPWTKTCSKDEPTLLPEFAGKEKRRLFKAYPADFFLAGKMLFAETIEALYAIPVTSEMYQGCNFVTNECEQIYQALTRCGKDRMLEGDFSKFDTTLSGQILRAAGACLISVARALGADEKTLRMMESCVQDIVLSFTCANGTLVGMDFWNSAGNILTIIFNGIPNGLLHRVAYYAEMGNLLVRNGMKADDPRVQDLGDFRAHVAFGSVGDDSLASTDQPWYNMVYLQEFFKSIGLKYTAGDKTAVIVPFYSADKVSFCKRSFRYDERGRTWVAPLAVDSVYKSLHCYMASSTPELEIVVGNVHDALLHLARHERSVFEENHKLIVDACREAGILGAVKRHDWTYDDWWYKMIVPSLNPDPSGVPDSLD